jgi:hypothetical protein
MDDETLTKSNGNVQVPITEEANSCNDQELQLGEVRRGMHSVGNLGGAVSRSGPFDLLSVIILLKCLVEVQLTRLDWL